MSISPGKALKKTPLSQPLTLLGGISADDFLRNYWQKKPLLIRNAIKQFRGPLSSKEVLTLAGREDAESRLITRQANTWRIEHGPFSSKHLRQPESARWTVLVQDVQHFSYEAHELLEYFRFIPQARIDDLMVSYAVAGAGVGPHFDSYDVFLIQGTGRRLWQISSQKDLRLKPDMPLKILSHFKPTEEFVLNSGDMLYLPPCVAHNGVAETDCLTWSVGFRAPTTQELSAAFLDYLRDSFRAPGQYADPDIQSTRKPAKIDLAMQQRIAKLLGEVQSAARNKADIRRFTGCYLTDPKVHTVFEQPEDALSFASFCKLAIRYGLELDLKTRILYDKEHVFINGQALAVTGSVRTNLCALADRRSLSASSITRIKSKPVLAFFYQSYIDGVLLIARVKE